MGISHLKRKLVINRKKVSIHKGLKGEGLDALEVVFALVFVWKRNSESIK